MRIFGPLLLLITIASFGQTSDVKYESFQRAIRDISDIVDGYDIAKDKGTENVILEDLIYKQRRRQDSIYANDKLLFIGKTTEVSSPRNYICLFTRINRDINKEENRQESIFEVLVFIEGSTEIFARNYVAEQVQPTEMASILYKGGDILLTIEYFKCQELKCDENPYKTSEVTKRINNFGELVPKFN